MSRLRRLIAGVAVVATMSSPLAPGFAHAAATGSSSKTATTSGSVTTNVVVHRTVVATPNRIRPKALTSPIGIIRSLSLGAYYPMDMCQSGKYLWITGNPSMSGNNVLIQYDTSTNSVVKTVATSFQGGANGIPTQVTCVNGHVWVGFRAGGGHVDEYDGTTGAVIRSMVINFNIPGSTFLFTGDSTWGITNDGTNVWVVDYRYQRLFKLNESTGAVMSNIDLCAAPVGLCNYGQIFLSFDGVHVWTIDGGSAVAAFNVDGSFYKKYTIANNPLQVVSDGKHFWVTMSMGAGVSNTMAEYDVVTGAKLASISGVTGPSRLSYDGTWVWACDYNTTGTQNCYRIDPATAGVVGQVGVVGTQGLFAKGGRVFAGTTTALVEIGNAGPAVNEVSPVLTDTTSSARFKVGDTVSTTKGTWASTNGTTAYKWYRCSASGVTDPSTNSGCTAISGATASTYVLTNADLGLYMVAGVVATGNDSTTTTGYSNFSTAVVGPPGQPVNVSAPSDYRQLVLTWSAPTQNGGATITGYTATVVSGGTTKTCTTTGALTCTVTGLADATTYTITVTATNSWGTGPASTSITQSTFSLPGTPIITRTTGDGTITVNWSAVTNGGDSSLYYVATKPSTTYPSTYNLATDCKTSGLTCTFTGLTNGTSYCIGVFAVNVVGSVYSVVCSVVPSTIPSKPSGLTGAPGPGLATINWTAPNNGGQAITRYVVNISPSGQPCFVYSSGWGQAPSTTCTFSGLTNGTDYTFTVTAFNANGSSVTSDPITVTPNLQRPTPPIAVSVTPGKNKAVIGWLPPTSNGGSVITGYTITAQPGGFTCSTTTATTCIISGLDASTTYTFTATATNAIGTSNPTQMIARKPSANDPLMNVQQITAGVSSGCALLTNHTVKCWGTSVFAKPVATATVVPGLDNVTAIVSASSAHCALIADGTVKCWGSNGNGELGQGTSGGVNYTPTTVPGLTGITKLSAGPTSFCAVQYIPAVSPMPYEMSKIYCWGYSYRGATGVGTVVTSPRYLANFMGSTSNILDIATSEGASCVVAGASGATSGRVYCWGTNAYGVFGDGNSNFQNITSYPTAGPANTNVVSISMGFWHTCAILSTGAPLCWGFNQVGTLGTNAGLSSPTPVTPNFYGQVTQLSTVSAADESTCWSTPNGAVYCHGNPPMGGTNAFGAYNNGVFQPTQIPNVTGALSVAVSRNFNGFVCALLDNATVSCWGEPISGQLGDGAGDLSALNNGMPHGAPVPASFVISISEPDAPTGVSISAANGKATVSWTPPVSDGGATITSYTVTLSPGGLTCTVNAPATTCDITGLVDGTTYTATVVATNSVGNSLPSTGASITTQPPVALSTAAPVLTDSTTAGRYAAGDTVSVTNGQWQASGGDFTYAWYVCSSPNSSNPANDLGCTLVSGQTTSSYTLANADIGMYVAAVVTQTLSNGSTASAVSNLSNQVAGPAVNTYAPVMVDTTSDGSFAVGDVVKVSAGSWVSSTGSYTYSWYSCASTGVTDPATDSGCRLITGATSDSYTIDVAQTGRFVVAVVTATGTDGSTTSVASNMASNSVHGPAISVDQPLLTPSTSPYAVGDALTVSDGTWLSSVGPVTYQWYSCSIPVVLDVTTDSHCTLIDGATNSSFVLTNDQIGSFVTAVVTATGTDGSTTSVTAPLTTQGVTGPAVNTVLPVVSDTTVTARFGIGDSLSLTNGTWKNNEDTYSYSWYACTASIVVDPSNDPSCQLISGATSSTYTLTKDQGGLYIVGAVTATGTNGNSATAYSAPVGPVQAPAAATSSPVVTDSTSAGRYLVGDVLSMSDGVWKNATGVLAYSWYACSGANVTDPATDPSCILMAGETSSTLTLTQGETHKYIVGVVTATGTDGSTTSAIAASVGPVTAPAKATIDPVVTDSTSPGANHVGDTLSLTSGTWINSLNDYTYAWYSCSAAGVTDPSTDPSCHVIVGEVGSTYDVTAQDAGAYIYGAVTVTGDNGSTTTAFSDALGPIVASAANTKVPSVADTTKAGRNAVSDVLTIDAGTWTNTTGALVYAWYSCTNSDVLDPANDPNCTLITGASTSSLTLTNDLVGTYVFGTVTATGTDGVQQTLVTNAAGAVCAPAVATQAPVLSDLTESTPVYVGDTLSVSDGTWVSTTGPLSYSWYACTSSSVTDPTTDIRCSVISGANGTEYVSSQSDAGKTIFGVVTATGNDGTPVNAVSNGLTVLAKTAPPAPTGVSATAADGQVTISWTAPTSDGGSPITQYVVTVSPGGATCVTTTTTCTISGLTNGVNYTFTVAAVSDIGTSAPSTSASAIPYGTPDAPTLSATVGSPTNNVALALTAPISTGGAPISSYTVTAYDAQGRVAATCTTSSTSCSLNGLVRGATYVFKAAATTAHGTSVPSEPVVVLIPTLYAKTLYYLRGWYYAQRELDGVMMRKLRVLAQQIVANGNKSVTLTGFANFTALKSLSGDRALNASTYLQDRLIKLNHPEIRITTVNGGNTSKFGGAVLNRVVVIQGR